MIATGLIVLDLAVIWFVCRRLRASHKLPSALEWQQVMHELQRANGRYHVPKRRW